MFGHHDDDQPQDNGAPDGAAPAVADQPDQGQGMPDSQPQDTDTPAVSLDPVVPNNPAPNDDQNDQPEAEPALPPHPAGPPPSDKDSINDIISPAGGFPKRPTYQYPQGMAPPDEKPDDDNASPELIDIRDHALDELEPLLDKLDLPPEEMFRAVMMIMQSKDDQSLVKKAYEAAHAIKDDELRARALYDIVNEVNYFTQPPQEP